jgi:Skp family chaperone for outer membrane proteins
MLRVLVPCLCLAFAIGCAGVSTSSVAKDLTNAKDVLIEKVNKAVPGAEAMIDKLKEKMKSAKGDSKKTLEDLMTKLTDLTKKVKDQIAAIKKGGTEGLKEKMTDLGKDAKELEDTVKEAEKEVKKEDKKDGSKDE